MQAPKHTSLYNNYVPNGAVDPFSGNKISLYHGEVRESITDLEIGTGNGPMTLTRTYRQFYQDTLRFMGAGWSHSHYSKVRNHSGGLIYITLPDGGDIALYETAPDAIYYRGFPGLPADMYWNYNTSDPNNHFEVRFIDGNCYQFGADLWLKRRIFPNGKTWTYQYRTNSNFFDYGLLKQVTDEYGNFLAFRYHNTQGVANQGFKHRQLWRVGDQETVNLDTSNVQGRYVEYDYSQSAPATTLRLLRTVRDVNGKTWRYDYGDTRAWRGTSLSPLRKVSSPLVIAPSTGFVSGEILQRNLNYVWKNNDANQGVTQITQSLGQEGNASGIYQTIETYNFFRDDALNPRTEVTIGGKTKTHKFDNKVYSGTQDAEGALATQQLNSNYQISQLVDANGHQSSFSWTSSGMFLQQSTNAEGYITRFVYEDNDSVNGRLIETEDAIGRITRYWYTDVNAPRQPSIIRIVKGDEKIKEVHYLYNGFGSLGHEIVFDPQYSAVSWKSTIEQYDLSKAVSHIKNDYTTENNRMLSATIIYDLQNPANTQTTTYQYDEWGRIKTVQRTSMMGSCHFTHTIYDASGRVTATVCGTSALPQPYNLETLFSFNNDTDKDKYRVTIYIYDAIGRLIKERTNVGSPNEQVKYLYYDALNRPQRTVVNVMPSSKTWEEVGQWVWDATLRAWKISATGVVISSGYRNDQNLIEDYRYNEIGKIRFKRDSFGQATLYGYTPKGNLKRVIENASNPDYFEQQPDMAFRINVNNYVSVTNPDRDIETEYVYEANELIQVKRFRQGDTEVFETINEYEYGALGNVRREIINPSDDEDLRTKPDHYILSSRKFDEVGRVCRTHKGTDYYPWLPAEARLQFRYTLYGIDHLDRGVRTIESASDPQYVVNPETSGNQKLSNYPTNPLLPSADADLDLITDVKFDVLGQKIHETDVLGQRTWYAYDGLGRVTRTVKNAVGVAEDKSVNDPRNSGYVISPLPDRDLVTNTFYNTDGHIQRIQEIKDPANPNAYWTFYQYDRMGRVTREIRNAAKSALYAGNWNDTALDVNVYGALSPDSDKDLAIRTIYDYLGRVQQVIDEKTGNTVYTGYDNLGRTVVTVRNYLPQGATNPLNWIWNTLTGRWENGSGAAIDHGTNNDQNLISITVYDVLGRSIISRASDGIETRVALDHRGRVVKHVENFVNGVYDATKPDEDLATFYTFHKAGYLLAITDPRGSVTAYEYDRVGRRIKTISAYGTPLATTDYTCYNKVGDVLRIIQNYVPIAGQDPDKRTAVTTWQFNPLTHGPDNDQNLITEFRYDKVGRQTQVINPVGNTSFKAYNKAGVIISEKDPLNNETLFFYDQMRRLVKVIQAFLAQPPVSNPVNLSFPQTWYWDAVSSRWEDGFNNAILHGTSNDRNLIVELTYDKAGRMTSRREPRGYLTQYSYDRLDRRRTLSNPLGITWETQYGYLAGGRRQESQIYPGLNGSPTPYTMTREYDRAGRVDWLQFNDPANTPNVLIDYNLSGQRALMTEIGASSVNIRKTEYTHDKVRRLKQIRFDTNGDNAYEQTIQYKYDAGGLKTELKVVSDSNRTVSYSYDTKGRLNAIGHMEEVGGIGVFGSVGFNYTQSSLLKNITRATSNANEFLQSLCSYDAAGRLKQIKHQQITDLGATSLLTVFDYTVNALGNRTHAVERWMPDATGPMVERAIQYAYDSVSRLTAATHYPNPVATGSPDRVYYYSYDLSGNRLSETLNGTPRNFLYNAANQLIAQNGAPLTYDRNGNLLNDGANTYVWDRANRLKSMGGVSYAYDGDGNRVKQTIGALPVTYLLDVNAPLPVVLAETTGAMTTRYLHGPTGIMGQQNHAQSWRWMLQDGLGSVRAVSDGFDVISAQAYSPYGEPLYADLPTDFGFTGEQTDSANNLVYLRARYLNPRLGVFGSQDPLHTPQPEAGALALNLYLYAWANAINLTDATGLYPFAISVESKLSVPHLEKPINLDECMEKIELMTKAIRDLSKRYNQQSGNEYGLWELRNSSETGLPPWVGTWNGHIVAMRAVKNRLDRPLRAFKNTRDEFDNRCPDPDGIIPVATAWMAFEPENLLPEKIAKERGIEQVPPPFLPEKDAQDLPQNSTPDPDNLVMESVPCGWECYLDDLLRGLLLVGAGSALLSGGGGGPWGFRVQ